MTPRLPWRQREAEERPPRLVLRFALVTAVGLGVAAAAILAFTRHLSTVEAEHDAAGHAGFVADAILSGELQRSDFAAPLPARRRAELDRLFQRKVLTDGTLLAALRRADGVVTYATDHRLVGRVPNDVTDVVEAAQGTITSRVTTTEATRGHKVKALVSNVPVRLAGVRIGAATIYQDYGPIASAARRSFLPVAGILELVLVALYLLLVPLLARVSRRLRRQMERIEHQAFHDELTDLPNRLCFRDRTAAALDHSARFGEPLAVLLLDLDRFKEINDTLGHQHGDGLLRAVAARLRERLADDATLARLGGDEFGILLPGAGPDEAVAAGRAVREALEETFEVDGVPLAVDASIGVAISPVHGSRVEALLRRAEVAMYAAKARRLGVGLYDSQLDASDPAQLALLGELRRALEQRELVVYYQPKADLRTGAIVGAEALVRWRHPERGLIPPNEFLPFVERTGLSRSLCRYVVDEVARQLRDWREAGIEIPAAVNVSMLDLLDPELPDQIGAALQREGVDPGRLELEITESAIMADPELVLGALRRLSAMHVRLAVDDFGTGFSSLSYLKHLPVDVVKIDRAFVCAMAADHNDRAIVRATIALAHDLGRIVVAEGVETREVWDVLVALGCDVAQGYYIARPLPASEVSARLLPRTNREEAWEPVRSEVGIAGSGCRSPADVPASSVGRTWRLPALESA